MICTSLGSGRTNIFVTEKCTARKLSLKIRYNILGHPVVNKDVVLWRSPLSIFGEQKKCLILNCFHDHFLWEAKNAPVIYLASQ